MICYSILRSHHVAMPAEPRLSILMQVRKQLKQILEVCIARPRFKLLLELGVFSDHRCGTKKLDVPLCFNSAGAYITLSSSTELSNGPRNFSVNFRSSALIRFLRPAGTV